MCKAVGAVTQLNNSSLNGVRLCIILALILCFTHVTVNAAVRSKTCTSNCSLREWLVTLEEDAYSMECTLSQLEKSTALLKKVNYRSTPMRSSQIEELKNSIATLKGEIEIISSTCSTFSGPDCNITLLECNSKCVSCASSGKCSVCSGNWDGPTCSVCKLGWNGIDCNTPICNSKCTNCASPGICTTCNGNWNGATCSECNTGWFGSDCNKKLSLILTTAQITKFTNTIMPNAQITQQKLLFKASRDGFSASAFHSKCDNKGPTIVIVKSTLGAIFGGYTATHWSANRNAYASDSTAFLFSLVSYSKEERFTKLTQQNSQYGISFSQSTYSHSLYGPTFGAGHDLRISDNANLNSESYSTLCHSYCGNNLTYGPTAQTYLAGVNLFQVEDYEVYSL